MTTTIEANNLVPVDYSKLNDEQLLEQYNKTFNKDHSLSYISNKYLKTKLTKAGKLNQSNAYFHRRMEWRKKYINKLKEHFTKQLHERMPMKPPPKINEFGINNDEIIPDEMTDWNNVKNKPIEKLYLPNINEFSLKNVHLKPLTENERLKLRIDELERENRMLKEYIKQMNSKKLIEQIPIQAVKKHNKPIIQAIPEKQKQFEESRRKKQEVMNRNKQFLITGIPK